MRKLQRYLLPALIAGVASAATTIGGPVAGYVSESTVAQLRTILGVPGAYHLSDPLPMPDGVTKIRLAPGQDFALVESAGSAPGVLFLKLGTIDHVAPIAGAMPTADWIAFSPGAGSAMLYSSAANRLQVLKGLPDAPQVALDMDSTTMQEEPVLGAVSDDASLVLVASSSALYRVSSGGSKLLISTGGIASVTVMRNGADAALSDPTTGSIHLVSNAAGTATTRVLVSGLDGIGTIFPAADGASLFAARPSADMVSSIDIASGQVQSFASLAAPMGLTPLRNRDTFLISAKPHEASWMFYRDGTGGRIVFIPAAETGGREIPVRGGVR
ncbi:MAG TPA: hypothetical protein VKU19_02900 [Bryobacteraceae bacterium]|nr:hypothetical protein [Bryobacteraceae bacterium]